MSIKKPWLLLPAKVAYQLSHYFLKLNNVVNTNKNYRWGSFTWRDLNFANPLGISGGLDKNAEYIHSWWSFGAGFIEIGTVTPRAQEPNPGEILKRDNDRLTLWNKMGFPNHGVQAVKSRLNLLKRPYHTPLFINIGKNRDTPNERASEDYLYCIRELREHADAFIINISSPNTKGLRELLTPSYLENFLRPLIKECDGQQTPQIPTLLKLSPDLTNEEFAQTLNISNNLGIDGWVLTNTTTQREQNSDLPAEGGVSGLPLAERSKEMLSIASTFCKKNNLDKLLISSGGVLTSSDVAERLRLGAQLVQVYSALVFEGFSFFRKVSDVIKTEIKRDKK